MKIAKNNGGFTLIELIITIFLVSVGLIGVTSFLNASLESQFEAKNEVIAAGLAQEGSELVRNLVEYNRLNGVSWDAITVNFPAYTRIDYRSLTQHTANQGNTYVCLVAGRYQQCASGTGIEMRRTLIIVHRDDSNGDRLEIQVDVTWNDRTTIAKDTIYANSY